MTPSTSSQPRWLLCAAVALALAGCTGTGAGQTAPSATAAPTTSGPVPPLAGASVPDVVEQLEPSVVTVHVGDGLGSGSCTGQT
jgi:serine protease Do